ncbi:MAG: hypothetical protein N2235_18080 [Fischerella sp.]|nr:hypothetical protein [Fischerella sp.]
MIELFLGDYSTSCASSDPNLKFTIAPLLMLNAHYTVSTNKIKIKICWLLVGTIAARGAIALVK